MSSYFGEVSLNKAIKESIRGLRADPLVGDQTYYGIAPEATTVLYAPGDKLGLAAAFGSLVPPFLCVALLTVFLCRRTAEDLWVGGGQVVCEILNGIIKLIIKEPRPSTPVTNMPADSYGMPSAHSQYMGYFAIIIMSQTLKARGISWGHRALRIVGVFMMSFFTAFSRYYLYYHTWPQVMVGFSVGLLFGAIWLPLLDIIRKIGLLQWGLQLWPCRYMLVKDVNYSVLREFEAYENSLTKRQN